MSFPLSSSILVTALTLSSFGSAFAADQQRTQDQLHTPAVDTAQIKDQTRQQDQDRIYASELMTPAERAAYLEQLRLAKTEQERIALREAHRVEMDARAKAQGLQIHTPSPANTASQPGTGSAQGSQGTQGGQSNNGGSAGMGAGAGSGTGAGGANRGGKQ